MSRKIFRPHQENMYQYFTDTNHPALLVEMRLGKTLVTIRGLVEKGCNRILVAAPINAMLSWKEQLEEEGIEFVEAYGMSSAKREQRILQALDRKDRVVTLVNYEGFRFVPEMAQVPWETVVADESVKLKNPQAQVSRAFAKQFRDVDCRVILTGLVAPESDLDLFQQFLFLHGRFMNKKNFYNWRSEFFEPDPTGYSWIPKAGTRKLIHKIVHEKAFVLTRKEAGLERKKYYTVRTVQMTPEQRKIYKQVEKEFCYEYSWITKGDYQEYADETMWATDKGLWLRRIAGGFTPDGEQVISDAKARELLYLLQNDFSNESVVVWYKFRAELIHDLKFLSANGIDCAYMLGRQGKDGHSMSVSQAEEQESLFKQGKRRVMLCMEKLGAYAKDFSIASVAVYRSNEHSCDLRAQSEDRILSLGKEGGLMVVDLVTEDTNDVETVECVKMKKFNARNMMLPAWDRAGVKMK